MSNPTPALPVSAALPLQQDPRVRGRCPCCGAPVLSNTAETGTGESHIRWDCLNALGPVKERTCKWGAVL